jgi:thiosulfate/3-mercaptopyruvate sulfurtransferase
MNFTTLIDVESLAALLAQSDKSAAPVVVLDCRFDLSAPSAGRQAYLTAHIPGARHADLDETLAAPVSAASGRHPLPSPETMAERFTALGIGHDSQVIVYDAANGSFAARAWWLLRWLGAPRVAVLDGGFKAWLAHGGATAAGERAIHPAPPAASLRADVDAAAVATSADVLAALRQPARLLVDARAAERYAGAVEPIDPVAGHVPGAVNHPFTRNLGADGRFLVASELHRLWRETLGGHAPADVMVMCGSGVTACHDLLAMELAGLPGAKLYAGSWSEWIRDPSRPVARGSSPGD